MDWPTKKLFLKLFVSFIVIFYLVSIFVFRLFAEDQDDKS